MKKLLVLTVGLAMAVGSVSTVAFAANTNNQSAAFYDMVNTNVDHNADLQNMLTDVDGNIVGAVFGKTCAGVKTVDHHFNDGHGGQLTVTFNTGCRA